jgi:competence protein ComEC
MVNKSLIGIVLAYIAGIILAYWFNFPYQVTGSLALVTFLLCLLSLYFRYFRPGWVVFYPKLLLLNTLLLRLKRFRLVLVLFYLAVVLAGGAYTDYRIKSIPGRLTPFINTGQTITVKGSIDSDIEARTNRIIFNLAAESIENEEGNYPVKGQIQVVYAPADFLAEPEEFKFQYRDEIEIKGSVYQPSEVTVPGVFDSRKYLQQQGVAGQIYVRDLSRITPIARDYRTGYFFNRTIISLRHKILTVISRSLPEPEASILAGILLGIRTTLPAGIKDAFTNAGVIHVMAVSGSNIGFLVIIFLWFFRRVFVPQKIAALITIIIIFIFTFITGAPPSAMRAAVMATFALVAVILDRDKNFYHSLAIACLVVLLIDPLDLFNVGFQLSFGATLGILYLTPKIQQILTFKPRWLVNIIPYFSTKILSGLPRSPAIERLRGLNPGNFSNSSGQARLNPSGFNRSALQANFADTKFGIIAMSMAAQIGVFPLCIYYFNKVSLIGVLTNIAVIPAVGIIMTIGFITFAVSFLGSIPVMVISWLNGLLIDGLVEIIKFSASLPYAYVHLGTPSFLFIAIFFLFAGWLGQLKTLKQVKVFALVLALVIVTSFSVSRMIKNDLLTVTFLDVGQGEAIFLEFPDHSNMLVDGGGTLNSNFNIGERVLLPFLWHKGVSKVDRLVLTHPHYNHLDGLLEVLKSMPVRQVFTNGENYNSSEYEQFLELIAEKHIPLEILKAPLDKDLSRSVNWQVLNPVQLEEDGADMSIDNNSLVSRFSYGSFSLLLTGDIGAGIQDSLSAQNIKSTILEMPGHGRVEKSQRFFLKVSPACVIISAKSPVKNGIKDLANSSVYSTADYGTIILTTDGKKSYIKSTKKDLPTIAF